MQRTSSRDVILAVRGKACLKKKGDEMYHGTMVNGFLLMFVYNVLPYKLSIKIFLYNSNLHQY